MLDLNALSLPDLFAELTANGCLRDLVDAMFCEDVARPGDITTGSIIAHDATATGAIVTRHEGVVAGLEALPRIIDNNEDFLTFDPLLNDGDDCPAGSTIARLSGNLTFMLMIERIALNFIGHLSGVATRTRQYVRAIEGTRAVICDTRKTTPGLRNLEKYAVRCGGGTLHRLGLFDAALYKDNHLAGIPITELTARLTGAIEAVRSEREVRFVEVEVDSIDQLREVMRISPGLVDIVLLDNMPLEHMQQAVRMRDAVRTALLLEASGGVDLENVCAVAQTGIDRISVGAITHSAPWLDVGLDIT